MLETSSRGKHRTVGAGGLLPGTPTLRHSGKELHRHRIIQYNTVEYNILFCIQYILCDVEYIEKYIYMYI